MLLFLALLFCILCCCEPRSLLVGEWVNSANETIVLHRKHDTLIAKFKTNEAVSVTNVTFAATSNNKNEQVVTSFKVGDDTFSVKDDKLFLQQTGAKTTAATTFQRARTNYTLHSINGITSQKHAPFWLSFASHLTRNTNLEFFTWGEVRTSACPTRQNKNDGWNSRDRELGILMSHRRIWEDFVLRSSPAVSSSSSSSPAAAGAAAPEGMLVIFEGNDVTCINDVKIDCGQAMIDEVENAPLDTDLLYIGWCGDVLQPKEKIEPPWCLHAYAISLAGARKLQSMVDPCGRGIDTQLVFEHPLSFKWKVATRFASLKGEVGTGNLHGQGLFVQNHTKVWEDHQPKALFPV